MTSLVAKTANGLAVLGLSLLVWGWRLLLSPLVGPACRFEPSCSAYALQALRQHGAWQGALLTLRRLARCHPWGGAGYDPVPEAARPAPEACHHGHKPAHAPTLAHGGRGRPATEPS